MQPPTLASRLKQETRTLHALAERSGVMHELIHGRIRRSGYCALLRNLHALYEALETGLDHWRADGRLGGLWQAPLRRLPALEQDLDRLHDGPWRNALPLLPAAGAYVARLHELTRNAPELLVAHAYVRYLGDLHGGQMLATLVRRCFDLGDDAGTAFYRFGDEARVAQLRADFRAGLDALALAPAQADAFVAEACQAFDRHRQLFEELGQA